MATKWMKQHPKDATMPLMLAEVNQRRGNVAEAKTGYRQVLDIDPDNVTALNNLAWILTEEGDAKGLEYAEAAHRLAPFNPGVIDTLGVAVLKSGDAKRGVALLRMASVLAPKQQDIRLHLAKALVASGDKAGARKELDESGEARRGVAHSRRSRQAEGVALNARSCPRPCLQPLASSAARMRLK